MSKHISQMYMPSSNLFPKMERVLVCFLSFPYLSQVLLKTLLVLSFSILFYLYISKLVFLLFQLMLNIHKLYNDEVVSNHPFIYVWISSEKSWWTKTTISLLLLQRQGNPNVINSYFVQCFDHNFRFGNLGTDSKASFLITGILISQKQNYVRLWLWSLPKLVFET